MAEDDGMAMMENESREGQLVAVVAAAGDDDDSECVMSLSTTKMRMILPNAMFEFLY